MHCLREPAAALGSLLSVALSSTTGKQLHPSISGGILCPLNFKIVLDMGYTSIVLGGETSFQLLHRPVLLELS